MSVITRYLSKYTLEEDKILLLNALSGAVDIVDKETLQIIEDIEQNEVVRNTKNVELLQELRTRGYLFESEEEEQQAYYARKELFDYYISKEQTLGFVICPTMLCNLKCTYCFESQQVRNDNRVMDKEQVESIFRYIDMLKEERKAKDAMIQLFGGEPLLPLTLKVNEQILREAKKRNMMVTIISNGTKIKAYKELLEAYRDIIGGLQITLDGVKEIHDRRRIRLDNSGTFDEICEGIDILLEIGVGVNVRVNVDDENMNYLKEFIDFIKEKKWDESKYFYCDLAPVTDHHASNDIEALLPEQKIIKRLNEVFPEYDPENSFFKLSMFRVLNHLNQALGIRSNKGQITFNVSYCETNVLQFYVFAPDGYIYACPEAVGEHDLAIGTYDNEDIYLEGKRIACWKDRTIFRIPKCKECKIATFCGGGCAYAALKTNGDIDCPVCDNAEYVLAEYIDSIKDYILKNFD